MSPGAKRAGGGRGPRTERAGGKGPERPQHRALSTERPGRAVPSGPALRGPGQGDPQGDLQGDPQGNPLGILSGSSRDPLRPRTGPAPASMSGARTPRRRAPPAGGTAERNAKHAGNAAAVA